MGAEAWGKALDSLHRTMALVLPVLPKSVAGAFEPGVRAGRTRCGGLVNFYCLGSPLASRAISRTLAGQKRALLIARSSSHGMASNENDFDLSKSASPRCYYAAIEVYSCQRHRCLL